TSRSEDLASQIGQGLDKAKEEIGITTEKKGLFDSFKEKAGNFYDAAVEKVKKRIMLPKKQCLMESIKLKKKLTNLETRNQNLP
ncbi:hypothetical protein U1Q18_052184, partial [Sarracenia purpurea var. burkii]